MPDGTVSQDESVQIVRYRPAAYGGMVDSERGEYVRFDAVDALLDAIARHLAPPDQRLISTAQRWLRGVR